MNNYTINNLPAPVALDGNSGVKLTESLIKSASFADATVERFMLSNKTRLAQLIPTAQNKIIAEFKTKVTKQVADLNLRFCQLWYDYYIAGAIEHCNAALSVYKGQLRADVVKAALSKFEEVQRNLNEYQRRGIKEIEAACYNCEQIVIPDGKNTAETALLARLKSKYEESIMKQVDAMFQFHESSINEFVSYLSEKLNIPSSFFNE
jgi:hypothetical protein